jgi:signal transduction histidine kinase
VGLRSASRGPGRLPASGFTGRLPLLLLLLAVPGPPAAAQPAAPGPAADLVRRLEDEWRWVRFGPEAGVPTHRLLEVLESGGTTWLVSEGGLAWFDGYRWRMAPAVDTGAGGLPTRLTPDGHGGAWGVVAGRLARVSRDGWRVEPVPGLAGPSRLRSAVALDDDDLLLVIDSSVVRLRAGVAERVDVPARAAARLARFEGRLLRTRPGNVWLLADGAWRWDGAGWDEWSDIPNRIFRESGGGGLLAGSEGGVFEWDPGGRPRPVALGTAETVSALSVSPAGDAVVAHSGAIVSVRANGRWTTLDRVPDGLEAVRQLVHRDDGDLWTVGPHGLHLFRASGRRWADWRPEGRDEAGSFVNALLRSRRGELWIGLGRGLVVRDTGGREREIAAIDGQPLGPVTGLAEDTAGGIWISSGSGFAGAFRWDGAGWRRFGVADGLVAERVHRIVPDRRGDLWFLGLDSTGADGPGAFRWDGARFVRWGRARGLPGGRVYAFAEGPDGALWFGTGHGISRWRQGRWSHWPAGSSAVRGRVYALAVDSAGTAYFGHRAQAFGLGRITPDDRVGRVDIGPEGAHWEITDIQVGPDGTVWFATQGGLGLLREGVAAVLSRSSGLSRPRLWPVLPLADRVLVGGDGIFTLDLAESRFPPPVVEIQPSLVFASEVLLRWTPLAFRGVVPSGELETRYRLDGGEWSRWSLTRQMSLVGLRPGAHRLEVQAKGLFGQVGPAPAAVGFSIPVPWYRSRPAVAAGLLVAVALGTLLALAARRRREHRRALERLNAALAADIEERRRAEAALEESRRVVQSIADSVPSILFMLRASDGLVEYVNREVTRILGRAPGALTGAVTFPELAGPAGQAAAEAHLARLRQAADGEIVEAEAALRSQEGEARTLALRSTVFARDAEGRAESILSVAHDITGQRLLEAQLVQAQKMETVGRLAGGVAHDFNNILTAITGYADFAREAVGREHAARADLDEISRAAGRARTLTGQLLTFARRQVVAPRVIDLNGLVVDIDRMLRRLIGEHIELVTRLSPRLWPVRADAAQVEQVLVNLAVNARDAMPGGGRLVIATRNLPNGWSGTGPGGERLQGEGVLLTVEDDGEGMPAAVLERLFEPFFTTKGPGHGTGLGLATCYGIVRQAGGVIHADATPGAGATFYVAFPRARPEVDGPAGAPVRPPAAGGSESILLVEDEDQVRALGSRILAAAGYRVREACNGRDALRLLEADGGVPDLLLTDVVMPEMGGAELWEALRTRWPGLKVLFVSGYTESAAVVQGVADRSLPFLGKPFTGAQLVARVREVLDGS